MTETLNWLILLAYSTGGVFAARWIIQRTHSRWTGPTTPLANAFLYLMILAAVGGLSLAAAVGLYGEILRQGAFLDLVGLSGAIKFLLIFSGLWYASVYALKSRATPEAPK